MPSCMAASNTKRRATWSPPCFMSSVGRRLIAAVLILSLLPAAAWAQETGGVPAGRVDAADRDKQPEDPGMPEFDVPDANQPAGKGEDPGAWRTWGTDQKISRSERVTLSLFVGGAYSIMGQCSSFFQDSAYDELFKGAISAGLDLGFTLMPLLNIYIEGSYQVFTAGHVRDPSGTVRFEPDAELSIQLFLGAKVKFPLNLLGMRLFSVSKAESGHGVVPYFKFGFGLSHFGSIQLHNLSTGEKTPFFKDSNGLFAMFGIGVELRGRTTGGFVETFFSDLGTPEFAESFPSGGSGPLKTLCLVVGIAFFF